MGNMGDSPCHAGDCWKVTYLCGYKANYPHRQVESMDVRKHRCLRRTTAAPTTPRARLDQAAPSIQPSMAALSTLLPRKVTTLLAASLFHRTSLQDSTHVNVKSRGDDALASIFLSLSKNNVTCSASMQNPALFTGYL